MLKKALFVLSSILLAGSLHAQTRIDTLSVKISFPQGVASLREDYAGNREVLDNFVRDIQTLNADSSAIIHSVYITTSASPEGRRGYNLQLAKRRAQNIVSYLVDRTTLSPSQIKINPNGENWEGLRRIISDCEQPWRNEALSYIDRYDVIKGADEESIQRCKDSLKVLFYGEAWKWMYQNAFKTLREAGGTVTLMTSPVCPEYRNAAIRHDTVYILQKQYIYHKDTVAMETMAEKDERARKTYKLDSLFRVPVLAFRTNLFVPLMNVGIEVPVGNRISVGADVYGPWAQRTWMNQLFGGNNIYCFQACGGYLHANYWLGRNHRKSDDNRIYRLRGHSLGLVAGYARYDLETRYAGDEPFSSRVQMVPMAKGAQGEAYAAGVDYRVSFPLGKGGVHLELECALGYMASYYWNYAVFDDSGKGYKSGDGRASYRYFGPIKAGFNFVVPITANRRTGK